MAREFRRGVTLLEVLFSILITTVGLLGAIALIPVASSQARRGSIAEAMGVCGEAAIQDFQARGMANPNLWIVGNNPMPSSNRCNANSPATFPYAGYAYCIDPRGAIRYNFIEFPPASTTYAGPVMERISLVRAPGGNVPMSTLLADQIFAFGDDLAFDRPSNDRTLPAAQQHVEPAPGTRVQRQTEGRFSWMATLTPKFDLNHAQSAAVAPRNPATADPKSYTLSVVVLHNRIFPQGAPDERRCLVRFPGGGPTTVAPGGGDVLLSSANASDVEVRAGDWIMLAAPRTINMQDAHLYSWYRIVEADSEPEDDPATPQPYDRHCTIHGPDWPITSDGTTTAVIVPGVITVYEKTIVLEGPNPWQ